MNCLRLPRNRLANKTGFAVNSSASFSADATARPAITTSAMIAAALSVACVCASVCALAKSAAPAQPMPNAAPASSWSAATLLRQCKNTEDTTAQALCVGTVRGIVHGYQYGVLLVGNRNNVDANQLKLISLCINGTTAQTLIDEFVTDASKASPADLANTDAETVVLGSIHEHHGCQ
jgi:hypothetical protein